jgi:hypothetical protein
LVINEKRLVQSTMPVHHVLRGSLFTLILLAAGASLAVVACNENSTSTDTPDAAPNPFDAAAPVDPYDASPPQNDSGGPVNECAAVTGAGTTHGASIQTETWTAAGSPHILPYDTSVYGTLTLEPCAEVRLAAAKSMTLSATGKIVAEGTPTKQIRFANKDAAPFANIRGTGGASMRFAYMTIEGGGDPLNTIPDYAGTIDLQGADQTLPTQGLLSVDHLTIKGSKSNGIVLRTGAGFGPGSKDLVVTGSAQYPVSIWARAIDSIPTGTYTGNTIDQLLIPARGGAEGIREDATMHNRGVPYKLGDSGSFGTLYISKGNAGTTGFATLTIEPGVVVKVKKGGVIYVEQSQGTFPATGALRAIGTDTNNRVTFTSAEPTPAPGDWLGIWFGQTPQASNKIDYVKVEYAGGNSASGSDACNAPPLGQQNDAAFRIFGQPTSQFVTNTIIANCAGHGFDRGWRGTAVDFLPTNTFMTIGASRCTQTFSKGPNGECPNPGPPPCPQP